MNDRGEITILSCLLLFTLMFIVLLCALELRSSFALLNQRTKLFLCVKETKGEHLNFMKFMGRTNWGIKNINRASMLMMFIPGLQGIALDAQKAKKYLQYIQTARYLAYLKTLSDLKSKSCPLDPRLLKTPFKIGKKLFDRDKEGAAELKDKKWNYIFFAKPYVLTMEIAPKDFENLRPSFYFLVEEKGAILSSLLSSR